MKLSLCTFQTFSLFIVSYPGLDTLNFSLTCFLFDLNSIWQSKQSVVLTELNLSVRCAAGDESSLMTYVFEMARTQRRRLSCALYRSCKYAVELS